ncbi:hypothetical protein JCM21714_3985 [Gracilibacillus boraciitolerans JCM 21714]|uniref:Uncharacterized protein n=1 Tax=Gracilibacillus boraciitolerans JCM 21714 TaxID=1298598 RepID=W4VMZ3_9BACI|nr:hypothetical protein JCM21714_3985 [Gracilibacillus boraciitolerans JCM 21714]
MISDTIKASNAIKKVPKPNSTMKLSYMFERLPPPFLYGGLADLSLKERYPILVYQNHHERSFYNRNNY